MQVVVEGVTVSYEARGSGKRGMVLLPSLGTTAAIWGHQIEAFSEDFTIILPEVGGHDPLPGATGEPSLSEYARFVLAAMDAVGVETAAVIGVSMGGMIAQEMAIAAPSRVADLVLVSTVCSYPDESRAGLRARAETARSGGMEEIARTAVARSFTPAFRESHGEVVDRVRRLVASADPEAYAHAAMAVAEVNTCRGLGAVLCPALVIRAAEDESVPQAAAEHLASALPEAELHVLPGGSHLCNVEQFERFNTLVAGFLEEKEPDTDEESRYQPIAPW